MKAKEHDKRPDENRKNVWFITGASRGMGAAFARAALDAGHAVAASSRNPDAVAEAVGESGDLLVSKLDVTRRADAESAVQDATGRFGRIDVLVNNAGVSYKGFFEEMTPGQIEQQLAVNLLGPMNVTRAALSVMRRQRSGHIVSISSRAGLSGFAFSSAYAASKFGLEGWMDALRGEVEPFGITLTIVNPGFFRTDLASGMPFADPSIDDYDERRAEQETWWKAQDGQQPGDPARLAQALLQIVAEDPPPQRFIAGADAVELAEQKAAELQKQVETYRDLSMSLAHDNAQVQ